MVYLFQKGFNYSQDGTGNRLVYHLQGCNMRCPWCANPEGMKIDQSAQCSTVEDILKEVESCKKMFFGGGGVTFTGGEPTLQYEELRTLLVELQKRNISTAMETNGSHPGLPALFPYLSEIMIDCKQCDNRKHLQFTGIANDIILQNIELAAREHSSIHVRVPLIHGVNDGEEDWEKFLSFFQKLDRRHVSFEILPYHEYGKVKWEQCDQAYKIEDGFVSEQEVKKRIDQIRQCGQRYQKT